MKVPSVSNAKFARWVAASVRDLGLTTVARAMQTSEYMVKKIVSTGEIPEGVYSYSKSMGYVDMSEKEGTS